MRRYDFTLDRKPFRHFTLTIALAILTFAFSLSAYGQTETVLYSFLPGGLGNPSWLVAGLVFDSSGNLYGMTQEGGANNAGSIFELSPISGGGWLETTLYSFTGETDGALPWSSLAIDSAGNLYGTSSNGSSLYGTVFELSPVAGGGWHFTTLHSFTLGLDGGGPVGGVVLDPAGNVYGTASSGGAHGVGTVFELSPRSGGGWHFTVLHAFNTTDGRYPYDNLTLDSAGNLYGTTVQGGVATRCTSRLVSGCGVVFKLSPAAGGPWHYTDLHAFNKIDGEAPMGGVVLDVDGNLYGTTSAGGALGAGTIFKLSPSTGGAWHETLIHSFTGTTDGSYPVASLTLDALGNIYGTTELGGAAGDGIVFEFSHASGGGWTETVLHDFAGADGSQPRCTPVFDSSGNLYGTTQVGGAFGAGTAFEIIP
jgi:uncharacterized repeat protein (TIGR03803 family)